MIQTVSFTGLEPGVKLLISGAVHGNEKCGTYAIRRVLKEIEEGGLIIERGSVTFVPICNPRAFAANERFIERNLNRYLAPQEQPNCYEAQLGNILCPLLEQCDVLLDLHSYSCGGPSFFFIGTPDSEEHAFANCLGAEASVTGWENAKKKEATSEASTGMTEYARRFGALAVNFECGQNEDPVAPENAYRAIRNALSFLKLISTPLLSVETKPPTKLVEVKKVFYRGKGGHFMKPWKHLERVSAGEIIAMDENNQPVTAPEAGCLVLPRSVAAQGEEWFYWGQERK